jgi:hypothetical protein
MSRATQVHESRQLRRAKLTEGIKRHRRSLYVMRIAEDQAPLSAKDKLASRVQEIADELHKMENELHELKLQQIREELSGH